MNEETLLLNRIRAGDVRAFDTIVRQYDQRMLAVAGRLLGHGEDRADAVQDALLVAYRSIASFKGNSKLWTWLYRVLVNACLTIRRSHYRHRVQSLRDVRRNSWEDGQSAIWGSRGTEPACTRVEQAEVQKQVRDCIARLPQHYREVLHLRHIEELGIEEIAQRLGISRGTVKTRLHRARQALHALLEPTLRAQA
jgi:RNA polymerase sigma-70 factor, ECF subfamily